MISWVVRIRPAGSCFEAMWGSTSGVGEVSEDFLPFTTVSQTDLSVQSQCDRSGFDFGDSYLSSEQVHPLG